MGASEALLQPKSLRTDSSTVQYYTAGRSAGITFVLIPTIGMSGRIFEPLVAALAANFRVVVVDPAGFGGSSQPLGSMSIGDHAETVRAVIAAEQIMRPIMVGHGMGSQVVASLLAKYPDISAKAILIGPTAAPKYRSMPLHYLALTQDMFHEPLRASFKLWGAYLRCSPWQYMKTLPAMLRNRIDGNLAGCQAAVMIIRGAHDGVVPHAWAGKLAAIATVAGLFEIRGAPHHVYLTHTAEVADICEGFALASS
jgi:pimeloyl-ACP methyl ester carboxylesterase